MLRTDALPRESAGRRAVPFFIAFLLGCSLAAIPMAGAEAPAAPPGHPVRLGTRLVATLRAEVLGRSAADRAREAQQTLDELVRSGSVAWGEVHVRTDPAGRILSVDKRRLFILVPEDLDSASGETLDDAVLGAVDALRAGVAEVRETRSAKDLLTGLLLSLGATALFAGIVLALEALRRWLEQRLVALAGRIASRVASGHEKLVPLRWLSRIVSRLVLFGVRLAAVFVAYLWLMFVLRRFAFTHSLGDQLQQFLVSTARAFAAGALKQIPDLVVVALIVVLTRFLVKLSDALFEAIEEGRIKVAPAVAETTKPSRRIATTVLWIFSLIMAYPYLPGSGTEAFKGVSVVVGIMVSLGSTTIVGQVFSGFMLLYARVFKVGDFVRIGDVEGTVDGQGLFVTRIRTPWNDEMSIPNAVVGSSLLRNYSRSTDPDGPMLSTRVTIGYDAPWRQVEGLLLLAADRTCGLKKSPPPFVRHWSLADFYVEYELCARIEKPEERIAVLTELHSHVQDAFNEHGVQIMSPHYFADPQMAKIVPRERWYAAPAHSPSGPRSR
jgi:small-conductance mechanosensitive channel